MYDIIAYDKYKNMKGAFQIIHSECADQFIAGVLQWYQHDVIYPTAPFMGTQESLPPNIFNIIEYPNLASDAVLNLFTESDIHHLQAMFNFDKKTARDEAVKLHNNGQSDRYFLMLHDIELVMNTYNLFYCYQDDANLNPILKNPAIRAVW